VYKLRNRISFADQKVNFLFAFSFALALPFLLQGSKAVSFVFSIIFLPFTVIHEIGHYLSAQIFFPEQNVQISTHLLDGGLVGGCIEIGSLTVSWSSVLFLFSGSFAVIVFVILTQLFIRIRMSKNLPGLEKYLLFGLLSDLPNLLPIFPIEGSTSDGFRIWILLHDLIHLPAPTYQFSLIFVGIASFFVFYSSYYLGSSIHLIFTTPSILLHKRVNSIPTS